ncbi:putative sodium/metabolite cotransporter BASS2, chloroplastic [Porphyridium purpureum]|uniref:Putative sodium/metabolite cotransporter BASS2, chloroplastic n=1 Tax=Porphyridium purpureum TaxID=35688 RepID=A0A5J4YZ40_PORPP|nr:putative sodium/metabolite cotransporter BASS2, chloroplastic [Porphyridium purpureum]|eukprot:POR6289..scf209_3
MAPAACAFVASHGAARGAAGTLGRRARLRRVAGTFVAAKPASGLQNAALAPVKVCAARSRGMHRSRMCTAVDSTGVPVDTTIAQIDPPKSKAWRAYVAASTIFTNLFPVWTALVAVAGVKYPHLFNWLGTKQFTVALAALMLSMGITLSVQDFVRVLKRFRAVTVGFVGCYALMPVLSYVLGVAFKLPPDLLAGLVVVGSVNGGQASNLCTYIARGNVALSVMMTTVTTIGAIVMTPLLSKLFIGAVVPVDSVGIAVSTVQVVLLPIVVGMLMNKYANKACKAVLPFSPVIGVIATCLLVGSSVAQCASDILAAGWSLQIATALLHILGGLFGYFMPKLLGFNEIVARTTAIETAMKSSAFAFLLASLHFGTYAVRVPSAVSIVWMALIGSSLAVIYRFIPVNATMKIDRSLLNRKSTFEKVFGKKRKSETGSTGSKADQ